MEFGKASVVVLTMALTWLSGGIEARPVSTPGKGLSDAKPAARDVNAPAVAPAVAPEGPALPSDSTGVAEAAEMPVTESSEDSEEKEEYDVAEEDAGWMENPLFDSSLPSFAAAPPRGVSPDGPCSAAEWSAYQCSVRPTCIGTKGCRERELVHAIVSTICTSEGIRRGSRGLLEVGVESAAGAGGCSVGSVVAASV